MGQSSGKPPGMRDELPTELREIVYKDVFGGIILDIDNSPRGFVENEAFRQYVKNNQKCRLVFGEFEYDAIAPLVSYRVTGPTILPAWLAQRSEYEKLKKIYIRVNFETGYFVGLCSPARRQEFASKTSEALEDWTKEVETWNPGLTVVISSDYVRKASEMYKTMAKGCRGYSGKCAAAGVGGG